MKFRFRLQKALQYTAIREKKKQRDVAHFLQERNTAQQEAEEMESNVTALSGMDATRARDLAPLLNSTEVWLGKLKKAQRELEVATDRLEYERTELDRILARRKAMERVREDRRQEFRQEQTRAEQKVLDDLGQLLRQLARRPQ